IGQTMAGALGGAASAPAAPAEDAFALIEKLHKLLEMGALTQAEFDAKKAELLGRIR
ncbi:MAG: SHOCT domain-containing protein, partial [Sphingobium sp.]